MGLAHPDRGLAAVPEEAGLSPTRAKRGSIWTWAPRPRRARPGKPPPQKAPVKAPFRPRSHELRCRLDRAAAPVLYCPHAPPRVAPARPDRPSPLDAPSSSQARPGPSRSPGSPVRRRRPRPPRRPLRPRSRPRRRPTRPAPPPAPSSSSRPARATSRARPATSQLPAGEEARGPELARRLRAVLERHLDIDLDAVSPLSEGNPQDGLPPGVDTVGDVPDGRGAGTTRSSSSARATPPAPTGPSPARPSPASTAGTTRCPTAGSATGCRSASSATGRPASCGGSGWPCRPSSSWPSCSGGSSAS